MPTPFGFMAPVLAPAPTLADIDILADGTGGTSRSFSTAGLTWVAGQMVDTIISIGSTPTRSAAAGATDDVATLVQSSLRTPKLYLDSWTINGGALDATFNFTISGAGSRSVVAGLVYSGATGRSEVTKADGNAAPITSPSFTVAGGPRNILVIRAMDLLGAHVTNKPTAPTSHTLAATPVASTSNAPDLSSRSTLSVAYQVLAAGGLTWPGGIATVPAATWPTPADYVAQDWNAMSWAMLA